MILIKKWRLIALLCGLIVFIILATFKSYSLYQENRIYERFISFEISKSLETLLLVIMRNEVILEEGINGGEIRLSPEQASNLCYNYLVISKESQNLNGIATSLNKPDPTINNLTSGIGQDIHHFLSRFVVGNGTIGDCSLAKTTISLDDDKKIKLKQISAINKRWSEIAVKHMPETTSNGVNILNGDNLVNDERWLAMLREFSIFAIELDWPSNRLY